MSDFDKEAERERLREKYEQDRERREAAQRMSDLLLKGATMTNAHCGQCGSPVFRNQGDEFCPTCEEPRSVGQADAAAGGAEADAGDAAQAAGEPAAREGADAAADAASQPADAEETGAGGSESAAIDVEPVDDAQGSGTDRSGQPSAPSAGADDRAADAARGASQPDASPSRAARSDRSAAGAGGNSRAAEGAAGQGRAAQAGEGPLGTAQRELLDAVIAHSRAAQDADPRTAADHLAAAREAAEALSALPR